MRDRDISDDDIFIGLDVGGTFLKGARLDARGAIQERLHEPIRKDTPADLLGQFEAAVRTLEARGPARAVGVGLPGIVARKTGAVRSAPNVKVLDGLDVGAQITERTGRPAFAENDANAAALAESWRGAGRSAEHILFVTLGTGVGGALVFDGHIWQGRSGYAGEIGHVQAVPDGVPCGCGSRGCVETVAGIGGWIRRGEQARTNRETTLRGRELDPRVIVEAAEQGDPVALEIVDETARALGVGIAAALDLINVDRVVIGGGVAQAGPFLLDRIAEETRKRTFAHVFEDADFRAAELGKDAGVVGAARVAMVGLHR